MMSGGGDFSNVLNRAKGKSDPAHRSGERKAIRISHTVLETMSAYYIPLQDTSQEDGDGATSYHPSMADQSSMPRNAGKRSSSRSNEAATLMLFHTGWTTYAALAILALCTIANTVQLNSQRRVLVAFARPKLSDMREPSKYIGLNESSPTSVESFNTFPTFLSQIDSAKKSRIFEADNKHTFTDIGTIWPDARRFRVENTVSSPDFGGLATVN